MAKTVNFGVIYGMSAVGLAPAAGDRRATRRRSSSTPTSPAIPKVLEYQDRLLQECREHGYVAHDPGPAPAVRPRRPSARDSTYQQRNQAEREAINMEIQGSAADLIKLAMLNVYRRLQRENAAGADAVADSRRTGLRGAAGGTADAGRPGARGDDDAAALRLQVPLKVDLALGRTGWTSMTRRADRTGST